MKKISWIEPSLWRSIRRNSDSNPESQRLLFVVNFYKNGVIRLYQEVSKTFMLHALAAGITLDGSLETGTNSSSGLPTVNIEDTTEESNPLIGAIE